MGEALSNRARLAASFEDRSESNRCGSRKRKITFIPARVLSVVKQAEKHRIIVRILVRNYRGSFLTLKFGENKPLIGFFHGGQLDLIYFRDPGLKEGQSFPLWSIQ
jgi:hypothetical protein